MFGGPIRARFEGPAPRSCGREEPPITTLDLGPARPRGRGGLEREHRAAARDLAAGRAVPGGRADRRRRGGVAARGAAAGRRVVYLADAWLEHRRAGDDARLRIARAERTTRGAATCAPGTCAGARLRPSAASCACWRGCAWHAAWRRCPQGLIMGAHSLGRTRRGAAAAMTPRRRPGLPHRRVGPRRRHPRDAPATRCVTWRSTPRLALGAAGRAARGGVRDRRAACSSRRSTAPTASGSPAASRSCAARGTTSSSRSARAATRLAPLRGRDGRRASRRRQVREPERGARRAATPPTRDWLLVVDDDVVLPRALPRPLHRDLRGARLRARPAGADVASHAAWRVTRRRGGVGRARDALRRDRPGHRVPRGR